MKFLNGKEEVIDIEITSYGRYLISKGKFKPTYYSFFDDGVLYDSQYANVTESQNSIQGRIKNETPRLQAQANYAGSETKVKKIADRFQEVEKDFVVLTTSDTPGDPNGRLITYTALEPKENAFVPPIQSDADKFYSLKYPIGSSDLNTDNAPSWSVSTLKGVISSSSNHLTGAFINEKIPQLNLDPIEYKTIAGKVPPNSDITNYDYYFENGDNFINVLRGDTDELIIDVSENNTFFGEQNFDIEVYVVEDEDFRGETKQNMKPLYFVKQTELIKDGILLDENSSEVILENTSRGVISETDGDLSELRDLKLDPTYVDYYFSIDIDNEIDEETLCNLTVDKSQGIFSERYLDCERAQDQKAFDNSLVFDGDSSVNKIGDCE